MPRNSGSNGRSSSYDRSLIERNRRMHMRTLCSNLLSLITSNSPQQVQMSVPELVNGATDYIKGLDSRVKQLGETKQAILRDDQDVSMGSTDHQLLDVHSASSSSTTTISALPAVEVGEFESTLEVNIICGSDEIWKFTQVAGVLEEEGAVIINSSYHKEGERVFYTIYSQAIIPRIGIDASRVRERLNTLFS